jgi:hypothetical protein
MPFNGSGTFNPLITFVPNTLATAQDQNSQDVDFANGLTDCLTKDGQSIPTANLTLGGFRLLDVATPQVGTDAANMAYVQSYVNGITVNVRAAATGGTDTATTSDNVIYWNYSYSGTKTQNIPSAVSFKPGQQLVIKDRYGDCATNNINIIPSAGTIEDGSNFVMNINKMSVTLCADNVSNNWMLI